MYKQNDDISEWYQRESGAICDRQQMHDLGYSVKGPGN